MSRVIVVGLDSATFDLIIPWAEEGKLPTFSELLEKGACGPLESVKPPLSAQAWSTVLTGKNPGKHGIFGFKHPSKTDGQLPHVTSMSIRAKTILELLSELGKGVISVNVPMTYPPYAVNGILVSGMGSPGTGSNFTYPAEFKDELMRVTRGRYSVDLHWAGYLNDQNRMARAVIDLMEMVDSRIEATRYMMHTRPWDFFMVVFMAIDQIQHYFWKTMDPHHPAYKPELERRFKNPILRVYQKLDAFLGWLLGVIDEDTTLLVISDHGAGPFLHKTIYVNEWLRRKGLLSLRDADKRRGSAIKRSVRRLWRDAIEACWRQLFRRLDSKQKDFLVRLLPRVRQRVAAFIALPDVDPHLTQCYVAENLNTIRINVKNPGGNGGVVEPGKPYEALRDYLIREIESFVDPETGERLINKVYRREEIYRGPYVEEAPDLLIEPVNYAYEISKRVLENDREGLTGNTGTWKGISGSHRQHGILMAYGRNIARTRVMNAELADIAPTILHLLGVSIPDEMDGEVLEEVFLSEWCARNPVRISRQSTGKDVTTPPLDEIYSHDEAERINEQLRNLGYID
jgi:predicted AlkP superfamily phosphohydrolase/phosphomutase